MPLLNPFGKSSVIKRTPPSGSSNVNVNQVQNLSSQLPSTMRNISAQTTRESVERRHLANLQQEEETAFIELGSKLSAINAVASNAKNIHKTIRDNLVCVMALYQQLREYRDAIEHNPVRQVETTRKVDYDTKFTQTEVSSKDENGVFLLKKMESELKGNSEINERNKRLLSNSPGVEKYPKRHKTLELNNIMDPKEALDIMDDNNWKRVENPKKIKKTIPNRAKKKYAKNPGEALTIKMGDSKTYAEMLKQMKTNINPTELGVEINEMRRTQAGELLIKFKRGEGQAEKLKEVLSTTLGDGVTIKCATKSVVIDIRDMDESTEEQEIIDAIMENVENQQENNIKILNIRESYGKTKQALVKMPINIGSKLVAQRRIKIGWVNCRIREKEKITRCFRCLDQGHLSRDCKGQDMSNVCRKCCKPGHKYKNCQEETRCSLCEEAGLQNTKHFIGSSICINNRKNHTRKHDKGTPN